MASAIGGHRLSVVAEAFLRTPETLYRGMPDLLFWRVSPHGAPGDAQSGAATTAVGKGSSTRLEPWEADSVFAVEVKSSNDRYGIVWYDTVRYDTVRYGFLGRGLDRHRELSDDCIYPL